MHRLPETLMHMEYNIELLGIIVGSIATILGGVWFMLYKAFNLGKVSQRMEEIEKKTSNADCKVHKENIEKIKEHNLPQRVEQIEKKVSHADCEVNNSPTKLTDFGNKILEELDGINFINDNKEYLIARLDEEKPRTALDVENSALMVFVNFCSSEKFDGIKNFIYNSPEYNIKDKNGCDKKYNLNLIDVYFILSIPLRDLYLELRPEILNNV